MLTDGVPPQTNLFCTRLERKAAAMLHRSLIFSLIILGLILGSIPVSGEPLEQLQELSGVLEKGVKRVRHEYRLRLDGCTGSFWIRAKKLSEFQEGTRLWVRGHILTRLVHDPEFAKSPAPGDMHQQPIHWEIYMQVVNCKQISSTFKRPKEWSKKTQNQRVDADRKR